MSLLFLICSEILFLSIPIPSHSQWVQSLPPTVQSNILWSADHEEGSLYDWTFDDFQYAGGGIFNTGGIEVEAEADMAYAHSGMYSARATISNAFQSQNGSRAVRLMRWTDRPWDDGGDYLPSGMYYSAWYYFPHTFNPNKYAPWDPGDGGWWNIFQFKSDDSLEMSQPIWTFNVWHDDADGEMYLYAYSKENPPHSYDPIIWTPIPTNRWVHLEAWYAFNSPNAQDGAVKLWQDGTLLLDLDSVATVLESGTAVWGIGNYTDHIAGGPVAGSANLFFDDAIVSSEAIHPYLNPTGISDRLHRSPIKQLTMNDPWLHVELAQSALMAGTRLSLIDLQGRTVQKAENPTAHMQMNIGHLSTGLYVLQIEIVGQGSWQEKIRLFSSP